MGGIIVVVYMGDLKMAIKGSIVDIEHNRIPHFLGNMPLYVFAYTLYYFNTSV